MYLFTCHSSVPLYNMIPTAFHAQCHHFSYILSYAHANQTCSSPTSARLHLSKSPRSSTRPNPKVTSMTSFSSTWKSNWHCILQLLSWHTFFSWLLGCHSLNIILPLWPFLAGLLWWLFPIFQTSKCWTTPVLSPLSFSVYTQWSHPGLCFQCLLYVDGSWPNSSPDFSPEFQTCTYVHLPPWHLIETLELNRSKLSSLFSSPSVPQPSK